MEGQPYPGLRPEDAQARRDNNTFAAESEDWMQEADTAWPKLQEKTTTNEAAEEEELFGDLNFTTQLEDTTLGTAEPEKGTTWAQEEIEAADSAETRDAHLLTPTELEMVGPEAEIHLGERAA